MATTADSHPGFPTDGGAQFAGVRNTWSHIVVSPTASSSPPPPIASQMDSPTTSPPLSIDVETDSQSDSEKKQVWNIPVNEVGLGPVMGAVSWPALSDSTRSSLKSSTVEPGKPHSIFQLQVPIIPSPPQKTVHNNPISAPNHKLPTRQKKPRGGAGGGVGAGGGGATINHQQPLSLPPPVLNLNNPNNNIGKQAPVLPKDPSYQSSNNWGALPSQPHIGNSHPHPPHRNSSFRRSHPRGDGSYYGGRPRDPDRGNHDWNPHRPPFTGRDMMNHRLVPRNFRPPPPPPPPAVVPFIGPPPPPIRHFGTPMGFPDMASPIYYVPAPPPESIRGVPFVHAAPPSMFFHTVDPQLHAELVKQIDYYFSSDNLCKDTFLRQNMDEQGWVSVSLIASFNRVKQLTNNIQFVLDAMRSSTVVEVQGDRVRKRNDWMTWPLLASKKASPALGPQFPSTPNYDLLAERIKNVGLEEAKATKQDTKSPVKRHTGVILTSSSSEEQSYHSSYVEGKHPGIDQVGSDRSSTRS